MYCAIIGDLIGSRQLKDRHQVQEKLEKVLWEINVDYRKETAAAFLMTLGDEFQGSVA